MRYALPILALLLAGCSSGGSPEAAPTAALDGRWQVRTASDPGPRSGVLSVADTILVDSGRVAGMDHTGSKRSPAAWDVNVVAGSTVLLGLDALGYTLSTRLDLDSAGALVGRQEMHEEGRGLRVNSVVLWRTH